MNRCVSRMTQLLNNRVWNGLARGLWDYKNCGGKNRVWRRCWSHLLIRAAWSRLSLFFRGKRWTQTSTNVCLTKCWNGSRTCSQICTCPRPGTCCTIMRPRITPSSFGSFQPKRTSPCCTACCIRQIWPRLITFYSCASRFTWLVWWCVGDLERCNAWPEGDSGIRLCPRPRSVGWSRRVVCRCGRGMLNKIYLFCHFVLLFFFSRVSLKTFLSHYVLISSYICLHLLLFLLYLHILCGHRCCCYCFPDAHLKIYEKNFKFVINSFTAYNKRFSVNYFVILSRILWKWTYSNAYPRLQYYKCNLASRHLQVQEKSDKFLWHSTENMKRSRNHNFYLKFCTNKSFTCFIR